MAAHLSPFLAIQTNWHGNQFFGQSISLLKTKPENLVVKLHLIGG
jgi:hypothetical protein